MGLKFNPLKVELEYQKPGTGSGPGPSGYVRPVEWPNIESQVTSNSFVGLYAVPKTMADAPQFLSLTVTCPSGNYSVEWGDGGVNMYASAATATHQYDPSNSNLTDTSYGYKCSVVKITATTNITGVTLAVATHANQTWQAHQWLDIDIDIPTLTNFSNNASSMRKVETFRLRSSNLNSYSNLFATCVNLKKVHELNSSSNITHTSQMFFQCRKLVEIPLFNTSSVIWCDGMFKECDSLKDIPLFTFPIATNTSSFMEGCSSIETFPDISFPLSTSSYRMFAFCYSLQYVKISSLASITNAAEMFSGCYNLISIEDVNTTALGGSSSSMSTTFEACNMLTKIGFSHFSNATNPFQTSATTAPKNLGAQALDQVFTALPVASATRAISIILCPGKTGANLFLATSKNWTVLT